MKKELKTKLCPICHTSMVVKHIEYQEKKDYKVYYSVYCLRCGYGLQDAFSSRLNAKH